MDHIKLRQISVCLAIALHCLASSVAQDVAECSPRCWNPVQLNSGVWSATKQEGVANEEECKALCVNNGTCIGVDWVWTSNECWFQLPPYNTMNVNHWSLANCADECASYCWNAVKDNFHVDPGTPVNASDENHCKLQCSNAYTCKGVDWNATSSSCWLIIKSEHFREAMNGIRHWDIKRNLPTRCQTTVRTDEVTSSAVNVSTASNTVTSVHEDTKYSKESTTEWKTGIIVLAVLLGLCVLIIIGLIINTIRIGRQLNLKSDVKSAELDDNYEGIQSPETEDGTYSDLVQINPEEFAYE